MESRTGRPGTSPPIRYQSVNLADQVLIHHRAKELRRLGIPYSDVLAGVKTEFGVAVRKSTLSYWSRGLHEPLGRAHDFVPNPSNELAYLIGVQKGARSLNVSKPTYNYRVRLQSIDSEFVEEFDRCLSRVLGSPKHAIWSGAGRKEIHVVGCSFLLHRFLSQPFNELKPFVEHCQACVAAFLRGFFDSEGCVDKVGAISASNGDKSLLYYIQSLLRASFAIGSTGPYLATRKGTLMLIRGKSYTRKLNCYSIHLKRRDSQRFLDQIGITIARKRVRLENAIGPGHQSERPRGEGRWRRDRDFPPLD